MNCSGNHVRIVKMKRVNGRLVRPDMDEVFHVQVQSCSQNRYYRLNASNQFSVELDHLCNEDVCVYEEDGEYEVSYQIDGVASEEACVNFNRSNFHEITIINEERNPQDRGTLRLSKHVYDRCGNEVDSDETFRFEMRGANFVRNIILSASNSYTTLIEDIPFGNYVVRELNGNEYQVSYIVNGIESDRGDIEIDSLNGSMQIINRMDSGTHFLRICKWIQAENRLVKPSGESYEIRIFDGYAIREYVLDCANHYCITLEGNASDTFSIEEIDAENVVYEVNGESMDSVNVRMNQDYDVRIINMDEPSQTGSIFIRKWIEEDGVRVVPPMDMEFSFSISGYSDETYVLNDRNNFTMEFNDVESGYYYIREEATSSYDVSYEVNGTLQDDGYFRVMDSEVRINVINTENDDNRNIITILKRVNVAGSSDEVEVPSEGSFEVYLEGPEGSEYIMLNQNNNYQVRYRAAQGWYTMYEVNPLGEVTYRLDGVDHNNELMFYVDGFDHEAMVINHINRVNFIL